MKRVVAFSLATQPCCTSLVPFLAPVAPWMLPNWMTRGTSMQHRHVRYISDAFLCYKPVQKPENFFSMTLPIMQILQWLCFISVNSPAGQRSSKANSEPTSESYIYMEKSNYNETLLLYPLVIFNKGTEKVTCCSAVHWSGAFVTTESTVLKR